MNYISDGIRKEYGNQGIVVQVRMIAISMKPTYFQHFVIATQTVAPGTVATAMSASVSNIEGTSLFVPNGVGYARAAVATIGILNNTFGCISHTIQVSFSTLEHHIQQGCSKQISSGQAIMLVCSI